MLPNPYIIVGFLLALMGAATGGYLKGGADTAARWEAATERLKAEAAQTLADETAKAAAVNARLDQLANELDKAHLDEIEKINAVRSDAAKRLTGSLRQLAQCRADGRGPVPSAADAASVPEGSTPGGDGGLPERVGERLERIGTGANKLALMVRECVAWSASVGR